MLKKLFFVSLVVFISCENVQTEPAPAQTPSWSGKHVFEFSLGDSLANSKKTNYLCKHGAIDIVSYNGATVSQIDARFCLDAKTPINYREVQVYYNKLFGGNENNGDWGHWSFENNYAVPCEIYLFGNDTTCLEIIAYIAAQR